MEAKSRLDAIIHGYGPLWFLEALLVIFAVMSVWDALFHPGSGVPVAAMIMVAQGSGVVLPRHRGRHA